MVGQLVESKCAKADCFRRFSPVFAPRSWTWVKFHAKENRHFTQVWLVLVVQIQLIKVFDFERWKLSLASQSGEEGKLFSFSKLILTDGFRALDFDQLLGPIGVKWDEFFGETCVSHTRFFFLYFVQFYICVQLCQTIARF